jgi:putative endopeptidase
VSEQFDGYFVEPGVHHRGTLVLSEAIGDLAGVRLAFLAFRKSLEKEPVPVRLGLTPEQRFFIAFGQMRGDAVRLEAQRQILATDPHPVPRFRVIGTVSNLPEFQRAFSCPAGAEMVRPPEKRCAVW